MTDTIKSGLKTGFIGQKIIYFESLPSTMDEAREMAREGVEEGTVITVGEQTAGRGRLRRRWISPQGNIALSIILYPDMASLPYLVMIAALAVVKAIENVARVKAQIKWPNDILIGGKKVGGILIENEIKRGKVVYSIIGIGINVDLDVNAYREISSAAASLKAKTEKDLKIKVIQSMLTEFERLYIKLPDGKEIHESWRKKLVTLGQKVRAASAKGIIRGIAHSVDESGALYIRSVDGTLEKVVAGDVTLREN